MHGIIVDEPHPALKAQRIEEAAAPFHGPGALLPFRRRKFTREGCRIEGPKTVSPDALVVGGHRHAFVAV